MSLAILILLFLKIVSENSIGDNEGSWLFAEFFFSHSSNAYVVILSLHHPTSTIDRSVSWSHRYFIRISGRVIYVNECIRTGSIASIV